eukprot:11983146-Alexandrium_andersonii.AAC.1
MNSNEKILTFGGRQSLHLPAFDSIHGAACALGGPLAFAALAGGIILLAVGICPASADEDEEDQEHSDTTTASGTPVA